MPDKKLTDSEIIKAFECCYCDKPCRECPYYVNFECTLPKDDTEFLPKKMTEIINRLQCERNKYRRKVQNQREEINRLQAENERLKSDCENYKQVAEHQQKVTFDKSFEITQLKKENKILSQNADTAFQDGLNEAQDLYAEQVKAKIKAEAYKEFAERLKEKKSVYNADDFYWVKYIPEKAVDNLLKEMVGEDNA